MVTNTTLNAVQIITYASMKEHVFYLLEYNCGESASIIKFKFLLKNHRRCYLFFVNPPHNIFVRLSIAQEYHPYVKWLFRMDPVD